MDMLTAISALLCLILLAAIAKTIKGGRTDSANALRQGVRSIVAAQRREDGDLPTGLNDADDGREDDSGEHRKQITVASSRLTLQKRLKYSQLGNVPPFIFALSQIAISISAFLLARSVFGWTLQVLALLVGPVVVNFFINFRMQKRFQKFDQDYPQFLLSFVGMLKTGLNPMQALEAAAENLDTQSLVRQDVELMLERLRLGVSEERSIGSFGEDINHPEIELFVQSLLLSRKVGGNLSDTIDRLTRQVRKRQNFRAAAQAAVGLQRGSIIFIVIILVALEGYLYWVWPEVIIVTWTSPGPKKVAEGGLCLMILGLYLVRQVTKIRI